MTQRSIMASFRLPGVPARYVTPIATLCLCLVSFSAQAALFDDDEARRAILELRQKMDAAQLRGADEIRRSSDETSQLRRSLLELSNQFEAVRNESAAIRGQNEKLARDIADIQRVQKDTAQGVDERMRKFEPTKVTVDGREFVRSPLNVRILMSRSLPCVKAISLVRRLVLWVWSNNTRRRDIVLRRCSGWEMPSTRPATVKRRSRTFDPW